MKQQIEANDALQLLIHMMADNLATNRVYWETVVTKLSPNAGAAAAIIVESRQRIRAEMQTILDKIYENHGSIDLDELLGGSPNDSNK